LSGGVDSAVAAARLLAAGYRVEGLFMKNWEEDDEPGYCAAAEDLAMAREVAATLEIPLHKVNRAADYWHRVFAGFLHEYAAGRTPNPDILCNREIKFPVLLEQAQRRGIPGIATGHYAQIRHTEGAPHLLRAKDENKDQTYFLYAVSAAQLRHVCFPIGDLPKPDVRRLAAEWGLPNHARKDSTGICFIGERRFRDFLAHYLPASPGVMQTPEGVVVGEHQGLMFYTLGQRQGLGIGGRAGSDDAPWYVLDKDLAQNRLIVGQGEQHAALFSVALHAADPAWVNAPPPLGMPLLARLRHRQPLQVGWLTECTPRTFTFQFAQPQRAVTPGQSIVLYQGQECLGGAVITTRVHQDDAQGDARGDAQG
jgi:tRNA-specific 2-thiouridylase